MNQIKDSHALKDNCGEKLLFYFMDSSSLLLYVVGGYTFGPVETTIKSEDNKMRRVADLKDLSIHNSKKVPFNFL